MAGEEKICVFCDDSSSTENLIKVETKGLNTILEACATRNDVSLQNKISSLNGPIYTHSNCRKNYTRSRDLLKFENIKVNEYQRPELRQQKSDFDIKRDCLFCGLAASKEFELKRPVNRRRSVHKFEYTQIINKVRNQALSKQDEVSQAVLVRIAGVIDLIAAEARYHNDCYNDFMRSPTPKQSSCTKEVSDKHDSFQLLCDEIDCSVECQYTISELISMLQNYNVGETVYSEKQLRKKLKERYGNDIIITDLPGKTSIVVLSESAYKTIHKNWYTEKKLNEQDERLRIVQAAAAIIKEDISSVIFNRDDYELHDDLQQILENSIPTSLTLFLRAIICCKNVTKFDTKVLSLSSAIMSAARPRSYISPVLLSTGVLLHRRYGSRQVIDLLSSLGFCASYTEVLKFEYSATTNDSPIVSPDGFIQHVFDNADINTCTLSGSDTFHSLGGIKIVTPAKSIQKYASIPRLNKNPTAHVLGEFGKIPFKIYETPAAKGLSKVKILSLPDLEVSCQIKLAKFNFLDSLCLSAHHLKIQDNVQWNGFMQMSLKHCVPHEKSRIMFLPFINVSPTNPSTILSALSFAENECAKHGQLICVVTFDQQLYNIAMEILFSSNELGKTVKMMIRLGGFHLIMSFLGAIGTIMEGSGLEDVWSNIYATKTIPHMISGHAIARAIRAHLITSNGLHTDLLNKSPQLSAACKDKLRKLYDIVLHNKISDNDFLNCKEMNELQLVLENVKTQQRTRSRTAALWLQYIDQVDLLRLFIYAERTGDWLLHLHAITEMLPYFHSAGRNNYSKSAHLYVQNMTDILSLMNEHDYKLFVNEGYGTIRRRDDYWAGISPDQTIEQTLMRLMKVKGGLSSGRGLSDSVLSTWVNSLPASLQLIGPLEVFAGVNTVTSEQHVENSTGRLKRDFSDTKSIIEYLSCHSPFDSTNNELQSISTGVVVDESINCDKAKAVGTKGVESMVGKTFASVVIKRSDKVKSIAFLNKSVKFQDETIVVDPQQFTLRMLCMVSSNEIDLHECLSYELALHSPALFDDSGIMRHGCKSDLKNVICALGSTNESQDCIVDPCTKYVIDGGLLLHRVPWPQCSTFGDIMDSYCNYVVRNYGESATVVFDGYENATLSTKNDTHQSRYKKIVVKNFEFNDSTPTTVKSSDFLASHRNKTRLIEKLTAKLEERGVKVVQAECDADTLLVTTALNLYQQNRPIAVIASDTDVLILLLHHTKTPGITMISPGSKNSPQVVYDINNLQQQLGVMKFLLLLLHAMSGCDSTSTPFGKGKKTAFKVLQNSFELQDNARTFYEKDADPCDIVAAGEKFLLALYKSKEETLDSERYYSFNKKIGGQKLNSTFHISSLPPTSAAAKQHSLRVYHQVQLWLGNALAPTDWGWKVTSSNTLTPISTELPPAPEKLLNIIKCNCKTGCMGHCSCRKNGLKCSSMCGNCRGIDCNNRQDEVESSDDDEEPPVARAGRKSQTMTPPVEAVERRRRRTIST